MSIGKVNALACLFSQIDPTRVYFSSSDKFVSYGMIADEADLVRNRFDSPVIALDLHPFKPLLLCGAMDGSIHILAADTLQFHHSVKHHRKYVVCIFEWILIVEDRCSMD